MSNLEDWGCNDIGNKNRFVDQHHTRLKHIRETKEWATWDGMRWNTRNAGIYRKAEQTVKRIYDEAKNCKDRLGSGKLGAWAGRSQNRGQIENMLKLASEALSVSITEFDTNPTTINCRNGLLDLRTKKRIPHSPDQLLMKLAAVDYDPDAKCERWLQFLNEISDKDQELIDYIQQALGYSLTGLINEHCFFLAAGGGRNGKGTMCDTVRVIMGDYARPTEFDVFLTHDTGNVRVREEIGNLKGIRFAEASEADSSRRFSEALIKRLTGGDARIGAKMYGSSYEYEPTDKLWFLTNHLPAIKDATVGMWDRVRVIPFNQQFRGADKDGWLKDKLIKEKEGIFAWLVEGAYKYLSAGRLPDLPQACRDAIQEYRNENDILSRFISDGMVKQAVAEIGVTDTHAEYVKWFRANQEEGEPVSMQFFRKNMNERGVKSDRRSGGWVFVGYDIRSHSLTNERRVDEFRPYGPNGESLVPKTKVGVSSFSDIELLLKQPDREKTLV